MFEKRMANLASIHLWGARTKWRRRFKKSRCDARQADEFSGGFKKMRHKTIVILGGLAIAALAATWMNARLAANPGPSKYALAKTISIPGDEGWDYVGVDSAARRVYVSHG